MRRWLWSCVALSGAAFAGCSSLGDASTDGHGASFGGPGPITGAGGTGTASSAGPNDSSTAPVVAPEQEEAPSFRAPVVSGRWVWTANPDTGKVAIVDAKNFTVRLADAGAAPTFLTAIPTAAGTSEALVINVGSHDATLLSAADSGPVTALAPVPIARDANTWTVSKTGKFALAWTDSSGTTPDPAESFQDVSVVDLRSGAPVSTRLVAGILPSRVFIDDAETTAYVVATTGITVIDLATAPAPRVRVEEPVSTDPHDNAATRDVSVMPDGSYALIRHEGSPVVTLLELSSQKLSDVTLSGPVTDLDLAPDARSALAVVRAQTIPIVQAPPATAEAGAGGDAGASSGGAAGSVSAAGAPSIPSGPVSTLAILPIPGIFSAPTAFDTVSIDEVFGLVNIAAQGTVALLYTNALSSSRITLLETAPGPNYASHRTVDVRGYVRDVFPSPDGSYAIASLQSKDSGGKPGFAAIPVTAELPVRVQTTDAPVFAVAQSGGAQPRAVVTVSDGAQTFAAYVVRMPELVVDEVLLPSRPLAGGTGIVPDAGVAYIAETHPEGRITFIDLETGAPRTITGFEISAKVIDGN